MLVDSHCHLDFPDFAEDLDAIVEAGVTRKQLQILGSWSSEPRHLQSALEFLRAHPQEFPFDSLVTHRFTLEQANEALVTTARWESAKSVIVAR